MSRDNFSNITKEQLAKRVGYRCSFPECGAPTFGPSDEGNFRTTNVGTACHIAAASKGPSARRYVKSMTSAERKHIDNGIWMCRTHGKLIDDDETRFTIEILNKWKEIAETVAKIMTEKNCDYTTAVEHARFVELAPEILKIEGVGSENRIVGNIIQDCCVSLVWGKTISLKTRDFAIEHIRNAFQHGKATEITISASKNKIEITDNGQQFNPKTLIEKEYISGGTLSIKELNKETKSRLIINNKFESDKNILTVARLDSEDDILNITTCSHKITYEEFRRGNLELSVYESCEEIYLVLPSYISPSDIGHLNRRLLDLSQISKPVHLITRHLSDLVSSMIKESNPKIEVIELE